MGAAACSVFVFEALELLTGRGARARAGAVPGAVVWPARPTFAYPLKHSAAVEGPGVRPWAESTLACGRRTGAWRCSPRVERVWGGSGAAVGLGRQVGLLLASSEVQGPAGDRSTAATRAVEQQGAVTISGAALSSSYEVTSGAWPRSQAESGPDWGRWAEEGRMSRQTQPQALRRRGDHRDT